MSLIAEPPFAFLEEIEIPWRVVLRVDDRRIERKIKEIILATRIEETLEKE